MSNLPEENKELDDKPGSRVRRYSRLDNDLPTQAGDHDLQIIFWCGYVLHYHIFAGGDLMEQAYRKEMSNAAQAQMERMSDFDSLTPEEQEVVLLNMGEGIFAAKCAVCHGPAGQGMVGPNLTDEYFIHGGSLEAITKIIHDGVADKGMLMGRPNQSP